MSIRGTTAIRLYSIDVGLDLGDGQDASTLLGVEFGVNKLPNVSVRPPAILPAGQGAHTLHGILGVGNDSKIVTTIPHH